MSAQNPPATRILLADDHTLVRNGLRRILEAEPDLTVVAEAADGAEATQLAETEPIDVAILDIAMPRKTGLQAAREIAQRTPGVRTVMLSMYDNEQYLFEALKAGAYGYVLKSAADQDLLQATRAAMRGEPFLYPAAITLLIQQHLHHPPTENEHLSQALLTPREKEILKLIAEGHTARHIAETLTLSIRTIDRHRANIMHKLGMRDRLELTRFAIRTGLIEP